MANDKNGIDFSKIESMHPVKVKVIHSSSPNSWSMDDLQYTHVVRLGHWFAYRPHIVVGTSYHI